MVKYIDAEKLKVEIKGLQCEQAGEAERGYQSAIKDILDIINSLQQEQPKVDLKKEFDDYIENVRAWEKDDKVIEYNNGDSFNHSYDIFPIARHFYELGFNARKEG